MSGYDETPTVNLRLSRSLGVSRRHSEFLFDAVSNFYEEPVVLVEGRGTRLTDINGEE